VTTVYWTPEARSRLKEIQDYIISQDAAKAAKKVVTTLLTRTRQLESVPLSGHKIPDYPDDHIREILQRPYRIIYRVTEQQVEILTVMHYRQLLPPVTVLRSKQKDT
jgi:addiction module RelE/StbE family toxin